MTCLVWPRAVKEPFMSDGSHCPFRPRVEPYHDGELDAAARERVEQHLARCPECAEELAWLRSVSTSLAGRAARITDSERARLHEFLDDSIDAVDSEPDSFPLYRAAGALAAIAASILVLSCVWLNELPTRGTPSGAPGYAVAEIPAWERVAMNLRADPMPTQTGGEVYLADARLADWVLQGLAGEGNR